MILFLVVSGPADAVAPEDLGAAVAEGCGAIPTVVRSFPLLEHPWVFQSQQVLRKVDISFQSLIMHIMGQSNMT